MGPVTVGEENSNPINPSKVLSDELPNVQRLQHGLDIFLSQDMEVWTDLCAEDVVAGFPLHPKAARRSSRAGQRSTSTCLALRDVQRR
jgi:ketosteroid isomerase-like protein